MPLLNMLPLIVGVIAIVMAGIILFSGRDRSRYAFSIFAVSMGAWGVLITLFLQSQEAHQADFYARSFYVAAAVLIYSFAVFCMSATAPKLGTIPTKHVLSLGLLPILITGIILSPEYLSVFRDEGVWSAELNTYLYTIYVLYFVAYASIAFGVLVRYLRKPLSNRIHYLRIRSVAAVMTLALPLGALFNLFLPYFGVYDYIMIGPLFVMLVVVVIFYSMVRHQLFDIRVAAVRTLAYVMSLGAMASVYFGLAYLLSITLFQGGSTTGVSVSPINIVLALVLAFIFQPIKQFFDRMTNAVFYRDRYNSDEFMARVGQALTSTTDIRTLLRRVGNEIASTLKSQHATFVVVKDGGAPLTTGSIDHSPRLTADEVEELQAFGITEIYRRESSESQAKLDRWLKKRSFHLVMPLGNGVGWLMLGEAKAGSYSSRDVRVLNAISSELTIAIQNARSVQVVKKLNTHLQQRIDAATRELRTSNDKLRKLDETKDEFVSMASHQLRTPLTSIKGYLSMILEGDGGEISPQQEKLLKEAFNSSERMVRLIGDFLNVSRLQTGKFMVDPQPVDLARVIGDEIESMRLMAESHGLSLHYDGPETLPDVMIDEDKTRQVIMNFIDNAIYYSPSGTDIVVKLSSSKGHVVLEVRDQGIGVPKSEQAQLFTKFFRAENARLQRPDGTGVGLFLAKRVIEAQGGEIIFHSRPGFGSVFGFKLPLKK